MANGGSVIFEFKGDTSNLDKATKKTESALGTLAKSFTIGTIASQAVSKGIQTISNNLDGAISRFDTMRNFPKVMKNLGFQTEDAQKAVNKLSDGLLGLPTALDDSITYVQRFTAKNDDLNKSADIFLAINDAILAGGANAQTQSQAIEQFAQSFSKGKPDLMEWRTLLTAMPGQLKQVAIAMGYASADDLYEAFKNNKISMNDFTDALIRLDKEGTDSMSSFREQAKDATGGIATSMANLKTRTVRAITEAINKIDAGTKQYGGISGIIGKITEGITKGISKLGDIIAKIINKIPTIISYIKKLTPLIVGLTAGLVAFKAVLIAIKAISFATMIYGMISGFIALIPLIKTGTDLMLALNMAFGLSPIAVVAGAVAILTAGVVALTLALNKGTKAEKEQAEAMKQLAEESAQTKKSLEDMQDAQNKQITEGLSEINYIQNLSNELRTLADEQGNVAEKDRARAEFILGELNKALGTEYEMIDGQIQKYDELSNSIDNQIQKKKMQILLEAREIEYREALAKWTDLQTKKEEARLKVEEAQAEFSKKENKANAERLNSAIENYNNLDEAIKLATANIRTYEDAMTENLKGNTDKAMELLMNKGKAFTQLTEIVGKSQKEQTRILKEQQDKAIEYLNDYRAKWKDGVAGYTADGLAEAISYAERAKIEYSKVGQNINQGLINGLNSNKNAVYNTAGSIAQGILSKTKRFLGIASPSKVFKDVVGKNIALGIGVGFENNITGVEKSINNSMRDLISGMGNMFDLSPTLNNTTSSSSNVTVQVYNNMETDMMGNLINNIKTFSNGSRNDYNYGMS